MSALRRPKVVSFDIIETTFRIEPLGDSLVGLGLPAGSYRRLYAEALRDAISLACIGQFAPFLDVFAGALGGMLAEAGLRASPSEVAEALSVLRRLPPHPDAAQCFQALKAGGVRVFALSNGARASTQALLDGAGMAGLVDEVLSIDTVQLSKPRREVYEHAVAAAGVNAHEMMLVACHPWDVSGAKAAGLTGGYVARGKPYPASMRPPELSAESLGEIARRILDLPA